MFKKVLFGLCLAALGGCANTEVIESPKTAYVADVGEAKAPEVVWTSRGMGKGFDYLGLVKSRSWSYDGALDRLIDGGKSLRADAIIDELDTRYLRHHGHAKPHAHQAGPVV